MPLPMMTNKDDVDAIVAYLKRRPTGATVNEAKATIDKKYVDGRKISAYKAWGIVSDSSGKLLLTQRGKTYAQAPDEQRRLTYRDILRENSIYFTTLEWIRNKSFDQVLATDVASHWFDHFQTEIGSTEEKSILGQVTCFMSVVDASGLGKYIIGRKGQLTRLEIEKAQLATFVDDHDGEMESEESSSEQVTPSATVALNSGGIQQANPNVDLTHHHSPALHIDIQIHIDAAASPEQIDKIFESMAKHLYNRSSDQLA